MPNFGTAGHSIGQKFISAKKLRFPSLGDRSQKLSGEKFFSEQKSYDALKLVNFEFGKNMFAPTEERGIPPYVKKNPTYIQQIRVFSEHF